MVFRKLWLNVLTQCHKRKYDKQYKTIQNIPTCYDDDNWDLYNLKDFTYIFPTRSENKSFRSCINAVASIFDIDI